MRRLADLIQFMPRGSWKLGDLREIQVESQFNYTKSQLKTIPIFVIDNIMKWLMDTGESFGDFEMMIVPPFDEFWIEFYIDPRPVGIDAPWILEGFHCILNSLFTPTDDKKWEIALIRYSCRGEKYIEGPLEYFLLGLNAEGFITSSISDTFEDMNINKPPETYFNSVVKWFKVCLLALHFLSCSKVRTEEVLPPKRLLGNKALKRGQRQPVHYKVLDIEPLKVLLRTEGRMDEVGIKQALTNVRGHWRIYTPEKPLFGHFVGKVFIKDHARGSSELGIIKNTYNIKSPSESEN